MLVHRLCLTIFATELTGEGAASQGGRWNSIGTRCLYASGSRALAALEYAANVTVDCFPLKLSIVTLNIPDSGHLVLGAGQLPPNWRQEITPKETQDFGTTLLEQAEQLIIKIPSAIIPEEYNYLINPVHPDMKKVSITGISDFYFDTRLKK